MTTEQYQEGYLAGLADVMDDSLRQERSIAELEYGWLKCVATLAKSRRTNARLAFAAALGWLIVTGLLIARWMR